MSRCRTLAIALIAGALAAAPAIAARAPHKAHTAPSGAPSLRASRSLVQYGKSVTLRGHAAPGALVALEWSPFPFRRGYGKLSTTHANLSGEFSFGVRPSHAVHYRAAFTAGGRTLKSAAISVYVNEKVLTLSCNLCTISDTPGPHTLTVQYSAQLPPGRFAASGPVYLYFGLLSGTTPPQRIKRVQRVPLHRSGRRLTYTIAYHVVFPAPPFQFRVAACFKQAEAQDGLGLPGKHRCGAKTLTRRQYLGYLG
jgi:hypothetical protein